jgi:hypothetical protein
MPGPFVPYIVRPGDHLSKLAYTRGFDADEVWNHPKNAELSKKREREVLCAGDILYVPKKKTDGLAFKLRRTNRFVATVPTTHFEMKFEDDKKSFAGKAFTYTVDGVEQKGTADGEGTVKCELPITAAEVRIVFPDTGAVTTAKVGHLDPIDDPKGMRQRLKNKGYIKEPASEDEEKEAQLMKEGISSFQKDNNIPVTGKADDATKAKLKDLHGS